MSQKLIFIMSFIIPGSGHLYLKQFKKAILGLVFGALSYLSIYMLIVPNFMLLFTRHSSGDYEGALTIGAEEFVNDSFLILTSSVFGLLLLIVFLTMFYFIARDARKIKKMLDNGQRIVSTREKIKSVAPDIIPHAITMPMFLMMFIFMIIPAIISIFIVFTNYEKPILPPAFLIEWVGFDNFKTIFTDPKTSAVFKETFVWTLVWTFSASTGGIALGTFLAILTNNPKIKAKKLIRTIFLLPWAVPAFLTILVFQIFFSKIGAMNTIVIPFLTGSDYVISEAIGFLINPNLAKMTIIMIQIWLGFPFVYVLVTGILQAIPSDLYEASSIDGGGAWTNFWDITFPMIMLSAAPMFITQYTFNFNNVTIIYLLGTSVMKDVGAQFGPLETIASLGYRLTLNAEYATPATFTLITSIIVSIVVLISWIKTGAFKNEEVM